jgi:hypothetical protein
VNKLAMFLERRLFMFYHKNLKLMVNLKLKTNRDVWKTEASFHVVVGQASSIRM